MTHIVLDINIWLYAAQGEHGCVGLLEWILAHPDRSVALDSGGAILTEYDARDVLTNRDVASYVALLLDNPQKNQATFARTTRPVREAFGVLRAMVEDGVMSDEDLPESVDRVLVSVASQTVSRLLASNDEHILNWQFAAENLHIIEPPYHEPFLAELE